MIQEGRRGFWLVVNAGQAVVRHVCLRKIRGKVTILDEGPQDLEWGAAMELFAVPDLSDPPLVLAEYLDDSDDEGTTRQLRLPLVHLDPGEVNATT